MPIPTGTDFTLPDSHLTEVGRIAIEWSHLEHCLEEALWTVMYLPRIKRRIPEAITTHIPFRVRLDMLAAISDAIPLNNTHLTELQEILLAVSEQHRWRNLVIHAHWWTFTKENLEAQTITHRTARTSGQMNVHYEARLGSVLN